MNLGIIISSTSTHIIQLKFHKHMFSPSSGDEAKMVANHAKLRRTRTFIVMRFGNDKNGNGRDAVRI